MLKKSIFLDKIYLGFLITVKFNPPYSVESNSYKKRPNEFLDKMETFSTVCE